jgi:hypothetical protein
VAPRRRKAAAIVVGEEGLGAALLARVLAGEEVHARGRERGPGQAFYP